MRTASVIAAAVTAASLLAASDAAAQAARTFVSGSGSDANPCTLTAPCRSFAQALTQTNAGGEITILDPAGYGAVNITKSVSIINDGVGEAGVTVTSASNAIVVNVGASDVVNLRGLTLVGGGIGNQGVLFNNLGKLNIQNCVIRGFTDGIELNPTGTAQFNISDTLVSDVSDIGIVLQSGGSGTVTAVFNRVQASGAVNEGILVNGINSTGSVNATITSSTVNASTTAFGVNVVSTNNKAITRVMIVNSVVSDNSVGVVVNGMNATAFLAKTTIAGNTTAFSNSNSGALFSFGDNSIKSNGNDGGVISLVATK
jgi:hypothetical protein